MKHFSWIPALLIPILILNSCQSSIPLPSPTVTLKPTVILPTRTAAPTKELIVIPSQTATQTPSPQSTTTQAPTATSAPGPNIDLLYLSNGAVYLFNLRTLSIVRLDLSQNEIIDASLSPDKEYIAFSDSNGLHISKSPFTQQALTVPSVNEAWSPVFSNDNHLAYSDFEGLKIYNLKTKAITILKSHYRGAYLNFDERHNIIYVPDRWSPDGNWLWIKVVYWEGVSSILSNVFTGIEKYYSTCNTDIDWLPDSSAFVTTVFYSGYYSCGEDSGVFVIKVSGNDLHEQRVYSDTIPQTDTGGWSFSNAIWDYSGKLITFVQNTTINNIEVSRLLLLNYATNQIQELDNSQYGITSPKWSEDGKRLYYLINNENDSSLILLNVRTSEKVIIYHLPKVTELVSVIPDGDWLIARTYLYSDQLDYIFLINILTGQQIMVSDIQPDYENEPLLGILTNQ